MIYGDSSGSNTLVAGPGNDKLYAGTGGDYLVAGPGTDTLVGGPGNDAFQLPFTPIGQTPPQDTIVDPVGVNYIIVKPPALIAPPNPPATTTLSADITDTNSTDTISVASTAGIVMNSIIQIDSEEMLVTNVRGKSLSVNRGYNGTTIALHSADASVLVLPQPPEASPSDYKIYLTQQGPGGMLQATLSNLDNGMTLGQLTFALPPGVQNISLEGGPGNNVLQVNPSVTRNMYLYGGPGSNTLMAGSGSDTLVAGSGPSLLIGGGGDDVLYGGNTPAQKIAPDLSQSNGVLVGAVTGNTHKNSDQGNFYIDGLASTSQLTVGETVTGLGIPNGTTITKVVSSSLIWISQAPAASYTGVALVFGSNQQDGQDTLIAGSGNSELYAGSGGDLLIGGSAVTVPGPGGVTQYEPMAPSGRDLLVGGSGNDLLIAAARQPRRRHAHRQRQRHARGREQRHR